MSLSSNEQTKIFEVPNKLISRSFESIMKPSEYCPFPQRWVRLTKQNIILIWMWNTRREATHFFRNPHRTPDNDNWRRNQKDLSGASSKVDQIHYYNLNVLCRAVYVAIAAMCLSAPIGAAAILYPARIPRSAARDRPARTVHAACCLQPAAH
jgi:hypothetical protein